MCGVCSKFLFIYNIGQEASSALREDFVRRFANLATRYSQLDIRNH